MAQENLKPLKTLVFSMGILLVGGTVLLMTLVVKKVSGEKTATSACPGGHVDLKGRGTLMTSDISGTTMRATFKQKGQKTETLMIDICSGKILGTLTLETD